MKEFMLIDTHCHIQQITKYSFDVPLVDTDFIAAKGILKEAADQDVTTIINVGTNVIESKNSIELAQANSSIFASVGIHPNDLTDTWQDDIMQLRILLDNKLSNKIVGIGECGLDTHYPDYNLTTQKAAFHSQIELAREYALPLIIHTREAPSETLDCLKQYSDLSGTIHCFSEDLSFAQAAIEMGFVLGIGGTITYPKNERLRNVVKTIGIEHLVLETDAPFLPPQYMRGKQNRPAQIAYIAQYIAELLQISVETVAMITTQNAQRIFKLQ